MSEELSPIVYIIGDGGHAKDIKSIIRRQTKGFYYEARIRTLDDKDEDVVDRYLEAMSWHGSRVSYLIGVNSSQVRKDIHERMYKIHACSAPPLIDPTAIVPRRPESYSGCVFGPYSVLSADAVVGMHTHLNIGTSINQGSWVGNFGTLSPGARICGDCTVGDGVQMGANSTLINLINVAENVVIGAGAVVVKSIHEADTTYVGVPAKRLDKTDKYLVGYTP